MSDTLITHLTAERRFVLSMANASAVLDYQITGNTINFCHTFVPPEFRGKGLAEQLVRHGLAWARQTGLSITASCSYVQRFL